MESTPVGRRTRLQQAIKDKELSEEKKQRWFNARNKWRKRLNKDVNLGVVNNDNDDCGEEGIKVNNAVGTNSVNHNISVGENRSLGGADNDHNSNEKSKVVCDGNVGDSDDSLQILEEKWNPDYCYESHSSATASDSDGETISFCEGAEDEGRSSRKTVGLFSQQVFGLGSSSSGKDRKEISDAKVGGEDSNGNILKRKDRHKKRRISNIGVFRRFDGLFLPKEPENNARQQDFVGRRTRSHLKPKLSWKKRGNGTFSHPVTIDDGSSSCSDGDELRNNHVSENTTSCENGTSGRRGRLGRINKPEVSAEPKDDKGGENVVKRKRGRPPKSRNGEKQVGLKKKTHSFKTNEAENIMLNLISENGNARSETFESSVSEGYLPLKFRFPVHNSLPEKSDEVENIMLNTILDNGNARLETFESSVSEGYLPLKFRFPVHNSLPQKSDDEEQIERLFNDLDFSLQACDAGCSVSLPDKEDDNVLVYESDVVPTELCRQGKHYLILEDEIGIRCKFCSFVKIEIRDITPAFHNNPFGRIRKQEPP
ncbi:uncharacterized protein LOC141587186 [Silene latifolia]|uniref:uncharacterized protein LOC141587186 n=1 Tax=Silene latifolia TaxID=37657 RepID=UPI003D772242